MKLFVEPTDLMPEYDLESISPKGEMLLFDIETTGLKKETTQLYLIGCGYFNPEGAFEVRQWLAQSALDERRILEEFFEFASSYSVLVHFNGDGFDIPYVAYKAQYYGFDFDFSRFRSFDIYKKIKGCKKYLGLERMGQTAVEKFLNIERRDKLNGGILIPYYFEYEKSKDSECERLLLLHNNDDVRGMILLADILAYADAFDGIFEGEVKKEVYENTLILEAELKNPVKRPILYQAEGIMTALEDKLLQVNLEIKRCQAKIPVKNIADYFYLPEEDIVVHKDVARFVDSKHRRKATARNCFLKKMGSYVNAYEMNGPGGCPDDENITETFFIEDCKGKLKQHIPLEELMEADSGFIGEYMRNILKKM